MCPSNNAQFGYSLAADDVTGDRHADLVVGAPGAPLGDAEGEGEGEAMHNADQNGDNQIDLSELLRVVQFYNSANYGCEAGTEDGYCPGVKSE